MRLLITGGAGFIGSHLAERCLRQGWRVAVIDDLSTGSMDNIAHLKSRPEFSYAIDTVFRASLVQELVDEADLVFHFAAAVGVQLIVESPVRTIETNVHGTEVVLRAAAKKKKPVIIASTSEVYGKSTVIPFREDGDLVLGPTNRGRWSYACSKALDEFLGLAYWSEQRVPVTIVRFFNTVGPRQSSRYGMVLPRFVEQALQDQPITVFGTGEQKRCFGYVGDVIEALIRIVDCPNVAGEVINIGNDQEVSIEELARAVRDITGSHSTIRKIPYDVAYGPGFEDMFRRVPSLEKLERLTGFRPMTPLTTIVELVASHLRQKMDASAPPAAASWAAASVTA